MTAEVADVFQRGADVSPHSWHPMLRQLFEHWRALPPVNPANGPLPCRDSFDPIAVRSLLPYLLMLDVHRDPLRFRIRLVGTTMTAWLRGDPTGRWLDELPGDAASTQEGLAWVTRHGQPSWRHGAKRMVPGRDFGAAETLALPLASDGKTVDRLLCMGVLYDPDGRPVLR